MTNKKWFQTLVAFILVFILIFLIEKTKFIFEPVGSYLTAIAVPFMGAGLLYYITLPLVTFLEKYKIPRIASILITFLLLVFIVFLFFNYIIPIAQQQFTRLVKNIPDIADGIEEIVEYWQDNQSIIPPQVDNMIDQVTANLDKYLENFTTFILNFIGQLFGFVFSFVLIPFFWFFMLKDGDKLVPFISKFLSKPKANSFKELMAGINHTLSSFIQGQLIVSVCVGIMLYIGYVIIKLDYALTLALFGLVMNLIPFVGPFISAVPAVIIGFIQEPMIAVYVIIVMLIAQQIESNFISPNVMGRVLQLHPLTIITLILAAGSIAGFFGLLFIIPAYAVLKTIVSHFYHEWRRKQPKGEKDIF
ncbi:AI-2E family transporter [Radiobacillus deserti]|uniref:AI-2E family transporter n=1 Tax=Radiobacillus deserti TaxID=2594883 RepID=A0A516KK06_9BACI|nr:AI-2E family transporter [Radiobacillus deserti]QDP41716.1 AI-2E family transporter [Radiobacillus deserti]